ncbi:MAG: ribonuclease HII [Clostridia bacterium]|nr:ribonuclease HII [Clostridia bacterium]
MSVKKEQKPLLWENELKYEGCTVCGVDEAGRGPLVGRVYAAAVILPYGERDNPHILALNDSKKLTEKKRDILAEEIKKLAVSWCVAYSEVFEIEEMNILEASLLAMRRAIAGLAVPVDVALIDGNISRGFPVEAHAIVGGDGISPSIAAASILAKTERDRWCMEYLDAKYPEYGFAKHKGYGTKAHYEAIEKYGPCPEHRMSFLKKFYERYES